MSKRGTLWFEEGLVKEEGDYVGGEEKRLGRHFGDYSNQSTIFFF